MKQINTSIERIDQKIYPLLMEQVANTGDLFAEGFSFLEGLNKSKTDHILKSSYIVYFKVNWKVYDTIQKSKDNISKLIECGPKLYGAEYGVAISLTNLMYYSRRGERPYCDFMQALSDSSDVWKNLLLSFPKAQTERFQVEVLPPQHIMLNVISPDYYYNYCYMKGVKITLITQDIGYILDDASNMLANNYVKKAADEYEQIKNCWKSDLCEIRPPFIAVSYILSGKPITA
jgi:hypothetical protein